MDPATITMRASSYSDLPIKPTSISGALYNDSALQPTRLSFSHAKSLKGAAFFSPISYKNSSSFSLVRLAPNNLTTSFSISAVTASTPVPETSADLPASEKLARMVSEFDALPDPTDRMKQLLRYAAILPPLDASSRITRNRVLGCTAQVWVEAWMDDSRRMRFAADSDSEITRGFCACLIAVLDGATPEEVLGLKPDDLTVLNVVGLQSGKRTGVRSRANSWYNVLISMQKRTKALQADREGRKVGEPFPSMVIDADGIVAKGSYAQAQVQYLFPEESKVNELVKVLKEKKVGIVAHFYMDPEVQGVLNAAQKVWPHIHISDSLVMADRAVKMAEAGCQYIAVLGVDFMSENVRAILDQAGFEKVGVYRMSSERIGCSLADAAATPAYMEYLEASIMSKPALHVIYINTSLETKALSHEVVPTITCTSSNVVQTILQAFSQVPNLTVYYGPDSYMGANIVELFRQMTLMTDEEISEVHPKHNRDSIRALLPRLHYYQDGSCIVHHLFGHEVVDKINEMYCDTFLTAHLEVPGEMFSLAMDAKRRGMGVVGSTQNILDFIKQTVQESLDRNVDDHLQFVLGTESGMVTSIVAAVRSLLASVKDSTSVKPYIKVEIVFPVSADSLSQTSNNSSMGLAVVPGVASGEGCSIHGGCASCPYMKMNSLSALLHVCHQLPDEKNAISAYEAGRFGLRTPSGKQVAEVGCEPILHMRHFQARKELPDKLIHQILHQQR